MLQCQTPCHIRQALFWPLCTDYSKRRYIYLVVARFSMSTTGRTGPPPSIAIGTFLMPSSTMKVCTVVTLRGIITRQDTEKNVCDGLGGTVKRLADEAVRSGKCTIQDADDFMNWATTSAMKGVKFYFVTKDDCEAMTSKLQQVELQPVKGTLQLHAVKLNSDRQLCTRATSCYCDECVTGRKCDSWTVIGAHKSVSTNTGKSRSSATTYTAGDFIAVVYEGDWYIGQIEEIDHGDDLLDYNVTFMQKRKALFQWPNTKDVLWRKKSHTLCKIKRPSASGKSKRMYKLAESEITEIERRYSTCIEM